MVVTLTGANSFGLKHELDSLVAAFLAEHDEMGLERVDGEEVEFDRLSEALTSLPFLASKKLVVLRSPGVNKKFIEQAEKLYIIFNRPDFRRFAWHTICQQIGNVVHSSSVRHAPQCAILERCQSCQR